LNNTARGGPAYPGLYLDGFHIYSAGEGGDGCGGAIYSWGAMLASNCVFSNNLTFGGAADSGAGGTAGGGVIFNVGSTFLDHCIMSGNGAIGGGGTVGSASTGQGGAIYNAGSMQIDGSLISDNTASGGIGSPAADGQGGAIHNVGSAQISASTISDNTAAGGQWIVGGSTVTNYANAWGGAIDNIGLIQVSDSMLISNDADGSNNFGIAIYNSGAFLADTKSFVTANTIGIPPLVYDWQINGTNIPGLSTSTINLTNVQFNDAGTYSLLISNSLGLVTNFDEILNQPVTNAPAFVLQPVSQVTNLGATVEFEVAAVGFPAPTYQWVFDGTNLAGATTSLLILTNVLQNQSGTYTVIATNYLGSSTSQQAVLTVNGTILLTGIDLGAAGFSITGEGMAGMKFIIEISTDLLNWQPLQTNPSPFTFVDTNVAGSRFRFYRAVVGR
jgi:hypothetical protein